MVYLVRLEFGFEGPGTLVGWSVVHSVVGGAVITAPLLSHGDVCADPLRVWVRVAVIRGVILVGEVW